MDITKYSVIKCDVYAIQTGLLYIQQNGFVADSACSVYKKLYGDAIASGEQIYIDETHFVAEMRAAFRIYGIRTTILNNEPDTIVLYYNDLFDDKVREIARNNYMTILKTSYISPKQRQMMSHVFRARM